MASEVFNDFRLVGGTALSLQIGHRASIDIDLFSDARYGSIDFKQIDTYLGSNFKYVDYPKNIEPGLGKAYFIGTDQTNSLKLDVFYTDSYIQPPIIEDGIRLATIEEVIAMKLDIIQRGGRKKDFWDLHELLNTYNIEQMLKLHEQRYPYNHDRELILKNFVDFDLADNDFDPICYFGKHWAFIKEDITDKLERFKSR
ncbi:nucleotidyl transferase AbiEii/AbiGii toxin family protein [Tamlana fucoidanivorans]|nr:nucleotidyl transferase AbiEii/AbiGii toxin family protein [Tamlana fucoidanivorans]